MLVSSTATHKSSNYLKAPFRLASKGMGMAGRETAVNDSRKETAERVAIYQTGYVGRTCLSMLLVLPRLPRSGAFCCASVFLFFHFALGRILFI